MLPLRILIAAELVLEHPGKKFGSLGKVMRVIFDAFNATQE